MEPSRCSGRRRHGALVFLPATALLALGTSAASAAPRDANGRPAIRSIYVCISAEQDHWICDTLPGGS